MICPEVRVMLQTVVIDWKPIEVGSMPREAGTYLVAFDDGAVETYPLTDADIHAGIVRDGYTIGVLWAYLIPTPYDEP